MAEHTKIEWTDHTINFWEGCQNVSPACDNCYAEARNMRFAAGSNWGPHAARRKIKAGVPALRRIQRNASTFTAKHGRRPRVFFSSLSDIFDNAVDCTWRNEAYREIEAAAGIEAQLLTKRIGNVAKLIPDHWREAWPRHIGLMITVVNQEEATRDIPKLLLLKAEYNIPWVGLSIEPMLGPIDLMLHGDFTCQGEQYEYWGVLEERMQTGCRYVPNSYSDPTPRIDWVICGGESGPRARPTNPLWVINLYCQCRNAETPFLFKQWGAWAPINLIEALKPRGPIAICGGDGPPVILTSRPTNDQIACSQYLLLRQSKASAGRRLLSRHFDGFPKTDQRQSLDQVS